MIRSMTGYGRNEIKDGERECLVEVKSVNHRFLEVKTKYPQKFTGVEEIVKKMVKEGFFRGYFEVYVTFEGTDNTERKLKVDLNLARQYMVAAEELKRELSIHGSVDLNSILQLNGILKFDDSPPQDFFDRGTEAENLYEGWVVEFLKKALTGSLNFLKEMREKEGEILYRDITERLKMIHGCTDILKEEQSRLIDGFRYRFQDRLNKMLDGAGITPERLSQEIALIAEKSDITEELIRLESHLKQFRQVMTESGPVGRKLEFILQEMNRETNTIGSKSIDYAISQQVIAIKSELEKIREQVQNIE
ncbi:MAG: YicC family protein [Nitrospinae bacterium]|nr:YicC family protein [Nitrospinota bacterium]